eukprot:7938281-Lingulodinium_polyedra.AAC.1
MRAELWRRTVEKLASRAAQLLANPSSPATRAAQWNTYGVSTVLYPAHIDLPSKRTAKEMEAMYARVGRANGRAAGFVLGAIT